jgi:hypothetical protein
MSRAQLDASLPAMSLTFPAVGGGTFEVRLPPTQSYLIPSTKTSGQYCGGIENGGPAGTGTVILGDAVMSSQLTVFDIGQNQIGFAPQGECN